MYSFALSKNTEMEQIHNKYPIYSRLLILLIGLIYAFSVSKDPVLGDSLVFTLMANSGFDFNSNATNHILYSNLLALLHQLFPFINIHFLCVSISVISGVLCLFFLQKLLNVFNVSQKSIFMCIMILGFSFTFWRVSVITEVYTFYLLFVILFLINFFLYLKEKNKKYFFFTSLLLGLLLLIHIQSILFFPAYVYLIVKNFRILKRNSFYGCIIVVSFFSVLLIPVVLGHHPFVNLFVMSGSENEVFSINFNVVLKSIIRNSGFLLYNFLFFLIFIFWGVKDKANFDYIIIFITPFVAFCVKHDVSDSYVFHLVPYLFLIVYIGKGIDQFPKINILLPLLLPLLYFSTAKIMGKTSVGKNIEKEKGFKGGVDYMFFPSLHNTPDLSLFLERYQTDSLYEKPELKAMHPFVLKWEDVRKQY